MLSALRNRPVAAFTGPFWLSAFCAALAPTSVGYQDLAAFLLRQPGVSERWRDHLIASPFGTIHAATFSFSRPIGTAMSEPIDAQRVNFDPRALDVKVWTGNEIAVGASRVASRVSDGQSPPQGRPYVRPADVTRVERIRKLAAAAADRCAVNEASPPPGARPWSAAEERRADRTRARRRADQSVRVAPHRPRATRQCDRHRHPDVRRAERARRCG